MSLGIYDISRPSTGRETGMTPFIPFNHPTPKHAKPTPFDPARIILEGNANYLGSRKLRASKDDIHVKVRDLLDQDAVVNGSKIWQREIEYMNTGNVRLGPIADSKVYKYHQLFPVPAAVVPQAPTLMHLGSYDSVSSASSGSANVTPRSSIGVGVPVFDVEPKPAERK